MEVSQGKRIVIIALVVTALLATGLILWGRSQVSNNQTLPISQITNWDTYFNSAHGYTVSHPLDATVVPIAETDSRAINTIDDVEIFIPGKVSALFVTVLVPLANAPASIAVEQAILINLPLQQLARALRQYQIDDKNPATQDKLVGDLLETSIGGQKAYSFTLTKNFTLDSVGGYALPDGIVYNYIVTQNVNREKFIIHYPLNDPISESMERSFVLLP